MECRRWSVSFSLGLSWWRSPGELFTGNNLVSWVGEPQVSTPSCCQLLFSFLGNFAGAIATAALFS